MVLLPLSIANNSPAVKVRSNLSHSYILGGKLKPLKAPKKEKSEGDEVSCITDPD